MERSASVSTGFMGVVRLRVPGSVVKIWGRHHLQVGISRSLRVHRFVSFFEIESIHPTSCDLSTFQYERHIVVVVSNGSAIHQTKRIEIHG